MNEEYEEFETEEQLDMFEGSSVDTGEPEQQETEPTVDDDEPKAPSGTLDPDAIAQAVVRANQMSQQPQQRQMTQEEINEAMKVHRFDEDFAKALVGELTGGEPDIKAITGLLNQMHERQMQQAQTYAQALALQMQEQLTGQFNPALTYVQEQKQRQQQEKFLGDYPALKEYRELLPQVAQKLQTAGIQFKSEADAHKQLAKAAEATIKTFNPGFSLGARKQQAQKSGPKTPAIAGFGGQGGAGGGAGGSKSNGSADIWD